MQFPKYMGFLFYTPNITNLFYKLSFFVEKYEQSRLTTLCSFMLKGWLIWKIKELIGLVIIKLHHWII
jgi:hypothetical protein